MLDFSLDVEKPWKTYITIDFRIANLVSVLFYRASSSVELFGNIELKFCNFVQIYTDRD